MDPFSKSIEVEHLTKYYGKLAAIRDVSFSVEEGEIVGFLGPNGAGKSTTMRILSGLVPATSGIVRVSGMPVASHAAEVKRQIGYMPENNPLPEDMRVMEYLKYRARLKEIPSSRLKKRIGEVLELCDLQRKTSRKVIGTLSKGYRQRVGIADALLAKPAITIMDEPTIGLDPHQVLLIRDLLDSLRGETTVILSSHILAEVEMSCDRVIIINQGHLVASGSLEDLRREFIQQTVYTLQFRGNLKNAVKVIKGLDPEATLHPSTKPDEDGFYQLTMKTRVREDQSEAILQGLFQISGARLKGFLRNEPTLEDIFLAATRRSWDASHDEIRRTDDTKADVLKESQEEEVLR